MLTLKLSTVSRTAGLLSRTSRCFHYIQGQSPEPKIREYFYYIDHQGQLFLDDARMKNFTSCFKEKKFLEFFFKRLRENDTGKYYEEFPYFSPCGRERNYIRCDDRPVVFTHMVHAQSSQQFDLLPYGGASELLSVPFQPDKLCMLPQTGRVYHPAPAHTGGVGLIKSVLAIELSRNFEFGDDGELSPPLAFNWKGHKYRLTNEIIQMLKDKSDKG